MHAGRAMLGSEAAQLHDPVRRSCQVGHPYVVVAVDRDRPWAREAFARHRRERSLCTVRTKCGDTAARLVSRFLPGPHFNHDLGEGGLTTDFGSRYCFQKLQTAPLRTCLLYTSDAADEEDSVDLG